MPNERKFTRFVDERLIDKLKDEALFGDHLAKDISGGYIFPAFRNNRIDFYYKGSKLFSYNGTFTTHYKFASVVLHENLKDYISENDLTKAKIIENFAEGYEKIKSNAELYAGIESSFVSTIYHNSSYASCEDNIVVLDIEASFASSDTVENNNKNKQDRIDLVLLEKDTKSIYFVEAKHYSNGEIWSKIGTTPKVVSQLNRYNDQIVVKNSEIINAYNNYLKSAGKLFVPALSNLEVKEVNPKTILLVFGYDSWQKDKINEFLIKDGSLKGQSYRFVGEPTTAMQIMKAVREGAAMSQ